jgi:hypothetical protein
MIIDVFATSKGIKRGIGSSVMSTDFGFNRVYLLAKTLFSYLFMWELWK